MFIRWLTLYTEGDPAKQVLKTRFYFIYFTHYSGPDTQVSQQLIPNFSFEWFDIIQIHWWEVSAMTAVSPLLPPCYSLRMGLSQATPHPSDRGSINSPILISFPGWRVAL